jgi:pyruvate formate lyase activating enzyme
VEASSATGIIYDIQGFSIHDGPGIRTTVFMKGCPLRCPWCHSPESQAFNAQICYMDVRCVGIEKCGLCVSACPKGAITPSEEVSFSLAQKANIQTICIDRGKCSDCGSCAETCFSKALFVSGTSYTVEQVLERIVKDIEFFKNSNEGGVTISGGEPLCQSDFITAVLQECKKFELHTALDTTGFAKFCDIEKVLPFTDLFLYDLKHMNSRLHKEMIGVSNDIILENAKRIAQCGGKMQIRIPVISGFNDSAENLKETIQFCIELGNAVAAVQLLPYHRMGSVKYKRLQREDPMPDINPPSTEIIQECSESFAALGFNVMIH